MAGRKPADAEERPPAEDVPLLAENRTSTAGRAEHMSDVAPASASSSPRGSNAAVCRICLEEDQVANLEQPCACSGTVSYAHHDCVQTWVNAKGNATCELCKQPYTGDFEVPPPPPPPPPVEHVHFVGIRSVYLNPDGSIQREEEVLFDEDEALDERRRSSVQWCLTLILFTTLLLLLHHSMAAADIDGPPLPPPPPIDPPALDPSADLDSPASLFWVLTRMLLIGLPLYMVMRAAQEARRAALHAHLHMMRGVPSGISFLVPPPTGPWHELAPVHHPHGAPPRQQQQPAGPDRV